MTINPPPLKDSWSDEVKLGPRKSWSLWFQNVWTWIQNPTAPTKSPGDNTTAVATDAFVQAAVTAAIATATATGIGYGQTWQNVAGSRIIGTSYSNNTGKPIFIFPTINIGTGVANLTINGLVISQSVAGTTYAIPAIVPPAGTYSVVQVSGTISVITWTELR